MCVTNDHFQTALGISNPSALRETLVEVHEPSGAFALRGSHEDADGLPAGTHPRDVAADGSTARDLNGKIVECAWDKSARFALDDDEAFRENEDAEKVRS